MATPTTPDPPVSQEKALRAALEVLERRSRRFSVLRLVTFFGVAAGLVAGLDSWTYPAVVSLPSLISFLIVFTLHGGILDQQGLLRRRLALADERLERLRSRRRERYPPRVHEPSHPLLEGRSIHASEPPSYALDPWLLDDLDILDRPRSVFGFLDWTNTSLGARRLAFMLRNPLREAEHVRARQEVVAELASNDAALSSLLESLHPLRKHGFDPLAEHFRDGAPFAGRRALMLWANLAGSVPLILLIAMAVSGSLEWLAPVVLLVIINLATIAHYVKASNVARDRLLLFGPLLEGVLRLHADLDRLGLESPVATTIERTFAELAPHARKLLRSLRFLAFHAYGPIFEVFNVLLLWELRLLPPASDRFVRHREELERAAGALAELDALVSLALPLAEQDDFSMPEAVDSDLPLVEGEEVGHPLLSPRSTVRNPVRLGGRTRIWIITGANMSGKSTFLKSIGVNLILAGSGGPVCARSFRWTPLGLHTDINVRDSLDDGKSYFQVEVERVKEVIADAERDPRFLAIFDELFRGTNSEERVAIARALVRHLRDTGALLLVATHDRRLAELVEIDGEPGIANRHLEENVTDGVLKFDYRLRDGPARSRNAIRVLEAQGYPESIIRTARSEAEARIKRPSRE